MKRLLSLALLACASVALSGAMVGCSASANVDPNHDHVSTSTDTTGDTTYKKTTVRDANGNVVETKTQKSTNP